MNECYIILNNIKLILKQLDNYLVFQLFLVLKLKMLEKIKKIQIWAPVA